MPREQRQVYTGSTHTRATVSFHAHEGFDSLGPIGIDQDEFSTEFGRILSVTTEKTFGGAAGRFTITVKKIASPGATPFLDLWDDPEGVWVKIKFVVDGQIIDTMLGSIDSISDDTTRTGGGARSDTFTITGRDFGKAYEATELFAFYYEDKAKTYSQLVGGMAEKIAGTPEHYVRFFHDVWMKNHGTGDQPWVLPPSLNGNGITLGETIKLKLERMFPSVNGYAIDPSILFGSTMNAGTKLWDAMQGFSNGLLNEMWVDLAREYEDQELSDLKPTLFLRERPFPVKNKTNQTTRQKWNELRTHTLTQQDVNQRSVAKGGASTRFNYWFINLSGISTDGYGIPELLGKGVEGVERGRPGSIPIVNEQSISQHGLRRWTSATKFCLFQDDASKGKAAISDQTAANVTGAGLFKLLASWLKKVHDWYSVAPMQLSGTITTTRVMPEIRIGERIREQRVDGNIIYYCEGVSHEWQYPGAGRTTLTVTRGEKEGDDPLARVYQQYENGAYLTHAQRCLVGTNENPTDFDAIIGNLALGCFGAPEHGAGVAHSGGDTGDVSSVSEADRQAIEDDFLVNPPVAETDGLQPSELAPNSPAVDGSGNLPSLDGSLESTGTATDLPAPNAPAVAPNAPPLSQQSLERGDPINTDLLSDIDDTDDPLAGI